MKKLITISIMLAIFGLSNLVNAQTPDWAWAKSAGGTDDDRGKSVCTDVSGNVFMAGNFRSPTITFGTTTLTNAGCYDIFIAKYDATGNVLWAKSAGGTSCDYGKSVCTDVSGNVFMAGNFISPTITFGTTTLTNASCYDIFIAKYDATGNVLWAKSAGGGTLCDYVNSVATDASGNAFITGTFSSPTITFGTTTLIKADSGFSDIFIVKYDASGNVLWARGAGGNGGTGRDVGNSVATDANGNAFMTGSFDNPTITFGTITLTHAGNNDIFIAKYDPSGNVLWAKSAVGTADDRGNSVATDASGNVFMTGDFHDTITFGTITLTNAYFQNVFIVKYDANGNELWAKSSVGTGQFDQGSGVATDASGNAFITGTFTSTTITFGSSTLTNRGLFIVKYDAGGNVLWAKSADDGFGSGVATDASGNAFITGFFSSPTITFGSITLTRAGNNDIFIAKLNGTTGIEEISSNNSISIFPNPATSSFTLQLKAQVRDAEVAIYDVLGKEMMRNKMTGTSMEIEKGNMPSGVYFIKVWNNDWQRVEKIVVE